MTTSACHDHGWYAARQAATHDETAMNEGFQKWAANFPERAGEPDEVEGWREGWLERASWTTDAAGWRARAAAYERNPGIEYTTDPEVLVKVREYIRRYDGGTRFHGRSIVVSIDELLADLDDLIPVTPEVHAVITLIYDLWRDPHIEPADDDRIEFVYNDTPRES